MTHRFWNGFWDVFHGVSRHSFGINANCPKISVCWSMEKIDGICRMFMGEREVSLLVLNYLYCNIDPRRAGSMCSSRPEDCRCRLGREIIAWRSLADVGVASSSVIIVASSSGVSSFIVVLQFLVIDWMQITACNLEILIGKLLGSYCTSESGILRIPRCFVFHDDMSFREFRGTVLPSIVCVSCVKRGRWELCFDSSYAEKIAQVPQTSLPTVKLSRHGRIARAVLRAYDSILVDELRLRWRRSSNNI